MGDSVILTGDANVTGTFITALNTNLEGVSVSEFNIADNHRGDYILDLNSFNNNCISGCEDNWKINTANADNGAVSQNSVGISSTIDSQTIQENGIFLESTLNLSADSGHNDANQNTGGDSVIKTGDANVLGNGVTFANNNLSGGVILGFVNIFGSLEGDILLTEEVINSVGGSSSSTANTANGSDSINTTQLLQQGSETSLQTKLSSIDNNFTLLAASGDNKANQNTGGGSTIKAGNSDAQVDVLNVANSNLDGIGGWLVLINQAGQWSGEIIGGSENTRFSGSPGTRFSVDQNGAITVINSENGAGSSNRSEGILSENNALLQNSNAHINNSLNLSANTGGNSASQNTNGGSFIETGDSKVIANLVNFINNNIINKGRLAVTIVNVFGSWLGDFITPGSKKEDQNPPLPHNETASDTTINEKDRQIAVGSPTETSSATSLEISVDNSGKLSGGVLLAGKQHLIQTVKNIGNISGSLTDDSPPKKLNPFNDLSNILTDGKTSAKKIITINLAWLIFLTPLLTLTYVVVKGRRAATRFLNSLRKKLNFRWSVAVLIILNILGKIKSSR